jgi:hypothetical protein
VHYQCFLFAFLLMRSELAFQVTCCHGVCEFWGACLCMPHHLNFCIILLIFMKLIGIISLWGNLTAVIFISYSINRSYVDVRTCKAGQKRGYRNFSAFEWTMIMDLGEICSFNKATFCGISTHNMAVVSKFWFDGGKKWTTEICNVKFFTAIEQHELVFVTK